jgi:hypothetical protein
MEKLERILSARDTLKENSVPDDLAGLTAAARAISLFRLSDLKPVIRTIPRPGALMLSMSDGLRRC